MGKKGGGGMNQKTASAKERKAVKEDASKAAAQRAAEDAEWKDSGTKGARASQVRLRLTWPLRRKTARVRINCTHAESLTV